MITEYSKSIHIRGLEEALLGRRYLTPCTPETIEVKDEEHIVHTACRSCIANCGVIAHVRNGQVVKLEGDPADPMSKGRMCAKGLSSINMLYHPNRNKYPLVRVGKRGGGRWKRVSWDTALDTVAGMLMDRNRMIGEICAIASLAYPLIFVALVDSGVTNTTALSLSYVFRGFVTVYYVLSFTDFGAKSTDLLFLAPAGLLVSRATEGLLSFFLLDTSIPDVAQLIFSAACFVPLLILFVVLQTKKHAAAPLDEKKRLALFAEKHDLTAREMDILSCLCEGMSDSEIAEKHFISKNTVRFHVSNLLKKTGASSRTEVVRFLELL